MGAAGLVEVNSGGSVHFCFFAPADARGRAAVPPGPVPSAVPLPNPLTRATPLPAAARAGVASKVCALEHLPEAQGQNTDPTGTACALAPLPAEVLPDNRPAAAAGTRPGRGEERGGPGRADGRPAPECDSSLRSPPDREEDLPMQPNIVPMPEQANPLPGSPACEGGRGLAERGSSVMGVEAGLLSPSPRAESGAAAGPTRARPRSPGRASPSARGPEW